MALCLELGLLQCSWLISWWTKWFSGMTVAKLCRYFIRKLKRPMADSCCKILHTCTTKNQKLLFTYVNTVAETSWLWYHELVSVKTRSKEEQCCRSTLQWDKWRTDRTNNNLWLPAFQVKLKQHSCSSLEVKEKEIATRLRRNKAAKWHLNVTWTGNIPASSRLTMDFNNIPYKLSKI